MPVNALVLDKNLFPYTKLLPQPRHRLFCIHHAGSSAAAFRPWVAALAPHGIEVWALQLPGRENRRSEPAFEHIRDAASICTKSLNAALEVPYTLLGHSLGGKIAFAVAQQLAAASAPAPDRLVLSGSRSLQFEQNDQMLRPNLSREDMLVALKLLGGTPPELLKDPDYINFMLPLLRTDLRLNATAVENPGGAIDIPMVVFGGVDDPHVLRTHLDGWESWTNAEFQLHMLPGGHFFLFDEYNDMPARIAQLVNSSS